MHPMIITKKLPMKSSPTIVACINRNIATLSWYGLIWHARAFKATLTTACSVQGAEVSNRSHFEQHEIKDCSRQQLIPSVSLNRHPGWHIKHKTSNKTCNIVFSRLSDSIENPHNRPPQCCFLLQQIESVGTSQCVEVHLQILHALPTVAGKTCE